MVTGPSTPGDFCLCLPCLGRHAQTTCFRQNFSSATPVAWWTAGDFVGWNFSLYWLPLVGARFSSGLGGACSFLWEPTMLQLELFGRLVDAVPSLGSCRTHGTEEEEEHSTQGQRLLSLDLPSEVSLWCCYACAPNLHGSLGMDPYTWAQHVAQVAQEEELES